MTTDIEGTEGCRVVAEPNTRPIRFRVEQKLTGYDYWADLGSIECVPSASVSHPYAWRALTVGEAEVGLAPTVRGAVALLVGYRQDQEGR